MRTLKSKIDAAMQIESRVDDIAGQTMCWTSIALIAVDADQCQSPPFLIGWLRKA
jgi:hypothetical protein